nr:hypothetical protein [Tanacetum cinerariifolium]GFA35381.1 hypothetical protein [Tanacetum cinerariifolium]
MPRCCYTAFRTLAVYRSRKQTPLAVPWSSRDDNVVGGSVVEMWWCSVGDGGSGGGGCGGAFGGGGCAAIFLAVASLFFWQWEPSSLAVGSSSGSGNFIAGSGNALCILFPTILP